MRRTMTILLAALFAAACTGQPTVSIASPAQQVSIQPPSPSAMTASPDVSHPSSPSPTPVAAKTLAVRWKAHDPTGIDDALGIIGVARSGDAYVLVAELPYRDEGTTYSAWWSPDGRTWQLAKEFSDQERILALTAGGPGFVVAGFDDQAAVVWTSADGRAWQPVSDPSLLHGVISELVPTANGIVGFGWRSDNDASGIWTSPDGLDWLAATNESGLTVARGLQAVGAYDGRAIAIVDQGDKQAPGVWETTGRAEWTKTGTFPSVAVVGQIAGGARGWVALDSNQAWTSPDGRTWGKAVSGPDVESDVIVDDAGYIAVGWIGSLPGETCGDQRPFAGHTWTSADGRVWELMPERKEFSSAMVTQLLVVDRTLIGFGLRLGDDPIGAMPVARWTETLPDVSTAADVSDKPSHPITCGG